MIRFALKPVAVALSIALCSSGPALAQQAPAGASKASSAAVGGVSAGTIGAAVAVVAAAAALSGGSGGSAANAGTSAASASTAATAAAAQVRTGLSAAAGALAQLNGIGAGGGFSFTAPTVNGVSILTIATDLQARAEAAASNLALSNTVAISGVVNPITGVTICAAANTCTAQEKLLLAYDAANLARAASQALFQYLTALENASLGVTNKASTTYATATAALELAKSAALLAQTESNAAIAAYNALATALGITGTTLSATSGTTGSIGVTGTVSYTRGSSQ